MIHEINRNPDFTYGDALAAMIGSLSKKEFDRQRPLYMLLVSLVVEHDLATVHFPRLEYIKAMLAQAEEDYKRRAVSTPEGT